MRVSLMTLALGLFVGTAARAQEAPAPSPEPEAQAEAPAPAEAQDEEELDEAVEDEGPVEPDVPSSAPQAKGAPRIWRSSCRLEESDWRGSSVPDTPVYLARPDGACFCSLLATRATRASRRQTFAAWSLGTLAAALVVVGPVIGNGQSENLWERERGTLLAVSGVAIAPLAYYFFTRADRSGTTAARAAQAQADGEISDDDALYRACSAAKADWVASREASLSFGNITLERLQRTATETKASAREAASHAEESRQNADVANKAAEQAQQSAETAESASGR